MKKIIMPISMSILFLCSSLFFGTNWVQAKNTELANGDGDTPQEIPIIKPTSAIKSAQQAIRSTPNSSKPIPKTRPKR